LCDIFGGQSGTGTGVYPTILAVSCRYQSTNAPYSFIHSFTTDAVKVSARYFGFPLSVSRHQCSILIHSFTRCSYQNDKQAKPGSLQKPSAVLEIGERSLVLEGVQSVRSVYAAAAMCCAYVTTDVPKAQTSVTVIPLHLLLAR
jgi:hypothetical protein